MIIKKMRITKVGDRYAQIRVPVEIVELEQLKPGDYATWTVDNKKGRYIVEFEKIRDRKGY